MTARDFVYWLQGHFEISGTNELSPFQVQQIKNHLSLVFIHEIDPAHAQTVSADVAQAVHDTGKPPIVTPKPPHDGPWNNYGHPDSNITYRC